MSLVDPFDRTDIIHSGDVARLAATLDAPAPHGVPPLWHWLSFLDRSPSSTLGDDGHPREGGLVVSRPYPRRMFAGGRVSWIRPFPVDRPVRRLATVTEPVHKQGRRGPMAFNTVRLEYEADGMPIASEEQDLVYLPIAPSVAAPSANRPPTGAIPDEDGPARDVGATVTFDEATLFRFSALTFNSHRIHYDLPYATGVEGLPGLVVHGPLLIVRLLELIRATSGEDAIEHLSYRALAPAYCGATIEFIAGEGPDGSMLRARSDGVDLMEAVVRLRGRPAGGAARGD